MTLEIGSVIEQYFKASRTDFYKRRLFPKDTSEIIKVTGTAAFLPGTPTPPRECHDISYVGG